MAVPAGRGEIVSPSNAGTDRVAKTGCSAKAGIGRCLLVEQDSLTSVVLNFLRLEGGHHVRHAVVGGGDTLTPDTPFAIQLDTGALATGRAPTS